MLLSCRQLLLLFLILPLLLLLLFFLFLILLFLLPLLILFFLFLLLLTVGVMFLMSPPREAVDLLKYGFTPFTRRAAENIRFYFRERSSGFSHDL